MKPYFIGIGRDDCVMITGPTSGSILRASGRILDMGLPGSGTAGIPRITGIFAEIPIRGIAIDLGRGLSRSLGILCGNAVLGVHAEAIAIR